jgi:hypothetical protein
MDDLGWLLWFLAGAVVAMLGRQWYRRRIAAKLADRLLDEVVKSKDSFRR